ncbi:hypothetical protein [Ferruginibacter sp.]|jgi:uncharacterized protein
MVSYKIRQVFPKENERNERLFLLLQKAYIETRYKEAFKIYHVDLIVIIDSVKTLQKMMQESTGS